MLSWISMRLLMLAYQVWSAQKGDALPVHFDGQNVLFHGICEDIDETVYYVRFDLDWLEMIEINELAVLYTKGECMSFSASYYFIEIYPYTI